MQRENPTAATFTERVLADLKRDPKKAGLLGLLALVLVIVGGRMLLKSLPSGASAGTAGATPADHAGGSTAPKPDSPMPWLSKGGGEGQTDADPNRNAPFVVRNIFSPNPALYPPIRPVGPVVRAKPLVDPAAQRKAEERAIMAQAQALALQSTVVGASATAIINGQVLRVGGTISGFKVVVIGARTCVVEKKGLHVTLGMMN
jgi:hypothetical protein